MSTHGYMISQLMLEEHRQNVERASPNPDWPDPVPKRPTPTLAPLRQRVSTMLRSVADRLESPKRIYATSQTPSAE